MNRKRIFFTVGLIILIEAALLFLPLLISLIYQDGCSLSFLAAIGVAAVFGGALMILCRKHDRVIYAREGFLIVSLGWLALSCIGALPFVFSGAIPDYADAFFETVSGFTTTGASILKDVEVLSPLKSILFWRSFTHWIGGMGILVFVMAVIPNGNDRGIHIVRAEMPGPIVGKLVPKMRDTAKILYLIYLGMTVLQIVLLTFGEMDLFESAVHAFGTAGTGGFGIKSASLAGYSAYSQWVIGVFMLLFGVNFNLYYLFLIRKFKSAFKSSEFWTYLGIVAVSVGFVFKEILPRFDNVSDAIRAAFFQVSSIITTTGFSTDDFNLWSPLAKGILISLMFIGACAGSTGGGLKVSRVVILFKRIRIEVKRLLHPRSVSVVKFEGRTVDDATLSSVSNYFALYVLIFVFIFLLLSALNSFDFETNFSAAAACYNNIGPGFGAVGPLSSYADYSVLSKIILSFAMLFGRLEIWPLILALSPTVWAKK